MTTTASFIFGMINRPITVVMNEVAMACHLVHYDLNQGLLLVEQGDKYYLINMRAVDMLYHGHDTEESNDDDTRNN